MTSYVIASVTVPIVMEGETEARKGSNKKRNNKKGNFQHQEGRKDNAREELGAHTIEYPFPHAYVL